jgi:hypothetical protein
MEIKQIKINGIVYELPRNVRGDWNENTPESESYIHNRPFYEQAYSDTVQFSNEDYNPDFGGYLAPMTSDVQSGGHACIELYNAEDSKIFECADVEIVDFSEMKALDPGSIYSAVYQDPTTGMVIIVVFGAEITDDGIIPGDSCICIFENMPQEYVEQLDHIKISVSGSYVKQLDNKFINTTSNFNTDDASPVNGKAIEDAFSVKTKSTYDPTDKDPISGEGVAQAIEQLPLMVQFSSTTGTGSGTIDKTFYEIRGALSKNVPVILVDGTTEYVVSYNSSSAVKFISCSARFSQDVNTHYRNSMEITYRIIEVDNSNNAIRYEAPVKFIDADKFGTVSYGYPSLSYLLDYYTIDVKYNTPYDEVTNKAATMADIENALYIDEEDLI